MNKKIRTIIFFLFIFPFCVVLISFLNKTPTHDRIWEADVAVLPQVEKDANSYFLINIRDWKYTSDEIISSGYINQAINPDTVTNVWFIVQPFGSWDGVAHTYLTFDFADAPPLSFSIEARKELGEKYSATKSLFRQFEVIYQWGTEDDLLIRRALYLDNELYMYPLILSDQAKEILLVTLLEETKQLETQPRFYNTFTSNCTNTLAHIVNQIQPNTIPIHPSFWFTGFADRYLYSLGFLPQSSSFSQLKKKSAVQSFTKDNYSNDDFPNKLREYFLKKNNH